MCKEIEQQKICEKKLDEAASLLAQLVVASVDEDAKSKRKNKKINNSLTTKYHGKTN